MTDRPILFSGPMVRAIMEGRKTQTRRVAKFRALEGSGFNPAFSGLDAGHYCTGVPTSGWVLRSRGAGGCWNDRTARLHCPYGHPGDRLWVRETWALREDPGSTRAWTLPIPEHAPRSSTDTFLGHLPTPVFAVDEPGDFAGPWRPSIHMPRWASRLTLEVVSVRVERLQEISELDAVAEGIGAATFGPVWECARDAFAHLWDSINGERASWESNHWVWRVEFRRLSDGARVSMEGV